MKRLKRLMCLLSILLLISPLCAVGDSFGCFLLDLDQLDLSRVRDASYIATELSGEAQGLRVNKYVCSPDEAPMRVRLIVMREDGTLLLDKSYEPTTGLFDSGDIYFTSSDTADMRYEITLMVGEMVYQLPFQRALGRLHNNTACTYGLRFQDGNGQLTDTYMMGTLLSLRALEQNGGHTQISLCASNRYLIGVMDLTLENGSLTVTPMLYGQADANIRHCYVYLITHVSELSSITPSDIGLTAYEPSTPIDVSGLNLVMLYTPMLLDYSPVGLDQFAYDIQRDAQLQNQLMLWDACWNQ